MVYFNEKYGEIKWDEINNIVIVSFHGYMNSEQIRNFFNKILECLIKHKSNKAIHDTRNIFTFKPEDQEWLKNDWRPRVYKALGKNKVALIMTENLIQKQVINKVADSAEEKVVEMKAFSNFNDALLWIKQI
jgi:hypothetical protein